MRLARLVALQEERLGRWTLDEQRERGPDRVICIRRAIMRNAFFSSITFSRNTPSCRGRFGLNCIAAVHLREYLENG